MRDQLGSSVSLSADGMIIAFGAVQEGVPGKMGYVKIAQYDESTDSFTELGSYISGQEGVEQFGVALSLSGDGTKIVISAFTSRGSGMVCVFIFEDIAWIKVDEDIESPIGRLDRFGYSVDIDEFGACVAVSTPESNNLAGAAYLFQLVKRGWEQHGKTIESSYNGVQLGHSVSVSNLGLVVSTGGEYGVQIYYDSGKEGPKPDLQGFKQIGKVIGEMDIGAMSISSTILGDGTTAAVATRTKDDKIIVHIYFYATATDWVQIGEDIVGPGSIDGVGKLIALSETGNTIVIGFFNVVCKLGENCGKVRVYSYEGNSWIQLGKDIVGNAVQGFLGWSVMTLNDGLIIASGAPISHIDNGIQHPGKVRVFVFKNSQWIQIGKDLEGDSEWDHLGSSVAVWEWHFSHLWRSAGNTGK